MSVQFTNEIFGISFEHNHIPYTIDVDGNVYLITGEKCYEMNYHDMKELQQYKQLYLFAIQHHKPFNKLRFNEYFRTDEGIKFMRRAKPIEITFKKDYDKIMNYKTAKSINNYTLSSKDYSEYMKSLLNEAKELRKQQIKNKH